VGEPHPGHLAESRVRLFRRGGEHANAHPSLLRRPLKSRAVGLRPKLRTTDPDELTDRGHLTSDGLKRGVAPQWRLTSVEQPSNSARAGIFVKGTGQLAVVGAISRPPEGGKRALGGEKRPRLH